MRFSKILFIFPETRYPSGQPPLGIAYLCAVIRQHTEADIQVADMSFQNRPFEMLKKKLREFKPDLVGISMVTPQLRDAIESARITRDENPDVFLMVGGPHPTVLPEETLERTGADLVYAGEGERAILSIVRDSRWESLPGACFRREDKSIIYNKGLLITEDLDTLPFPDRSIFDMKKYIKNWYSMDRYNPSLKGTSVMATRGCPFNCTFCQPTLSEIFGKEIRKRSPENILRELLELKETYNIGAFMFEDSTFILDKPWVHEICDRMINLNIDLDWCCNVRADLLTEQLLEHMVEAGLRKINIGVESASQRVLDDIYNKGITVEGVKKALELARKSGVFVQGYFMLGAPGESLEEIKRTISFAVKQPFDDAVFDITTPFPHTALWEKSRNLIRMDYSEFDCFQRSVYELEGIPSGLIERMKKRAFWKFYLHPVRILRTLKTALTPSLFRRTLLKMRRV